MPPTLLAIADEVIEYGFLAAVQESVCVQVFGRRSDETFCTLSEPASKKRQGTKSRAVGQWLAASAMGI